MISCKLKVAVFFLFLQMCCTALSWTGEPPTRPILRLETKMHTAPIQRIAVDKAGKYVATVSGDKTARIWDVTTKELIGILRVPQNNYENGVFGEDGQLAAVAIAPNGENIAVAGYTGRDWDGHHSIYIFNRTSQKLEQRISGLKNTVNHLTYSSDGRWIAAATFANGIKIFDTTNGSEVGSDHFPENDFGASSYSVDFAPPDKSGKLKLVSTNNYGEIHLHEVDNSGKLHAIRSTEIIFGTPIAARFSPNGKQIAVGFKNSPFVVILDSSNLNLIKKLGTHENSAGFVSVAWSQDGKELAAAGQTTNPDGNTILRVWSTGKWLKLRDFIAATDTVMDLIALLTASGGGWITASSDSTWNVLGNNNPNSLPMRSSIDFREQRDQLLISRDGTIAQFGYTRGGKNPIIFDLYEKKFRIPSSNETLRKIDLQPALTKTSEININSWKNENNPTINGKYLGEKNNQLPHPRGSLSRCVAISSNHRFFVLGTTSKLRAFNSEGDPLWEHLASSTVWAVNISSDNRWIVAAYGDGVIRWHRAIDGKEVLAFFPHADRKRWVLWTPEGFYDASPADGDTPSGEDLIGYHLNRGKDREGEFISATQLRDRFYNPALITARIGPNGDQLMADAVKQLGNVETLLANARNVPPVVKLLSPERVEAEEETEVRFEVQARGGGVGALKFYVDGQPVDARQMGVGPGETGSRRFKLAPGAHVIEVAGASKDGVEGPRVAVKAVFSGKRTRGTLHLLAIGVERYEDKTLTLKHSVRDAEQVAAQIAQRAQPLFDNVATPIVLKDDKATLAGITQAFDQMRTRFGPEDTLVIFLAGHGQARVGQFAFLPSDARRSADGALVNGLDETRLFQMLDRSPSHTLLLIDACDAGGMVELFEGAYERMGNVKKRAVIGASRRGQFALEGFEGHGVFTAALLQSLGKADAGEDLIVPLLYSEVKSSVTRISKQLKGGYQQEVKGYLGTADFAVIRR